MAEHPILDAGHFELLTKGIYLDRINSRLSKELCKFEVDKDGIILIYIKVPKLKWTTLKNVEKKQNILISRIMEIRKGAQSDRFLEYFKKKKVAPMDDLCISLVLRDAKTLDLRANTNEVRNAFHESLQYLYKKRFSYNNHQQRIIMYKEIFIQADHNGDSVLCLKEIVKLLRQFNLEVDENRALNLIKQEELNIDDFIELIKRLQTRKPIVKLFNKYSSNGSFLTIEEFQRLLELEQDEKRSLEKCQEYIQSCEISEKLISQKCLSLEGFYLMLEKSCFNIIDNDKSEVVYHDMNQPITHYFIDSSHNTYLEGDQFNSNSKIECFVKALKSGCRCVEIDVWDGNSEPIVCHGYANTTKLQFADVIKAVDKYAFETTRRKCSSYPVILSIENHCGVDQQKKMAKIMINKFGDKLLTKLDNENRCPSPRELCNKIIVKCKKADTKLSVSEQPSPVQEHVESPLNHKEDDKEKLELSDLCKKADTKLSVSEQPSPVQEHVESPLNHKEDNKKKLELSDLVVICQTAKFTSFEHSAKKHNFRHVISFEEKKAGSLAQQEMKEFIAHNMKVLSRIYPAGTRLKSSNYDPMPLWLAGCQIVALNRQTPTEPMFVNKGMFSDNGGCGYLLKPEFMRCDEKLAGFEIEPQLLSQPKVLFVEILDGFALPNKPNNSDILDPFIQVKIVGIPQDCATQKTEVVKNDGFNPIWNQRFAFSIHCPEMAVLLLEVHDHENIGSDVLMAQYCLRVTTLKTGYRFVQLRSCSGEVLSSNLIVHITYK